MKVISLVSLFQVNLSVTSVNCGRAGQGRLVKGTFQMCPVHLILTRAKDEEEDLPSCSAVVHLLTGRTDGRLDAPDRQWPSVRMDGRTADNREKIRPLMRVRVLQEQT